MNNLGQEDIVKIIGAIISLLFLIVFIGAMIPVFSSITGQDQKQNEINELNAKIANLEQEKANKEIEILQYRAILESLNSTLGEKDNTISNLTGQIAEKDNQIANLSNELSSYKEKEYLPTINNNYYNILNYIDKIENKFYTINLALGLISLTLTGIAIKLFGLDVTLKLFFNKIRKRKEKTSSNETTNEI